MSILYHITVNNSNNNNHHYSIHSRPTSYRYLTVKLLHITSIVLLHHQSGGGSNRSYQHPNVLRVNAFQSSSSSSTTSSAVVPRHRYYHSSYQRQYHQVIANRRINFQRQPLHRNMSSSTKPTDTTQQQQQKQDEGWMVSPMEQNHKHVPSVSMLSVVAITAGIPIWMLTVVPISILYQSYQLIRKTFLQILRSSSSSSTTTTSSLTTTTSTPASIDSGYIVDPTTVIEPSQRTYDIVVLGATGFTGYLAVRHLLLTYGINQTVKWAIAGRSQTKLNSIKERLQNEHSIDVSQLETIIIDTSIPSTLPKLVSQTRVIATTVGPYTLYGNHVIEFCCKYGTHYVDITGEVDWMKHMIIQWQSTAQQTGAKIIPFCGHDSIPWDISTMVLEQKLLQEQNDVIESVTFYDEMVGAAPGGTYATVLNSIEGTTQNVPRVDFDPFLRLPDGTKSYFVCNGQFSLVPKLVKPPQWKNESKQQWTTPFVMALVNSQVVRWSYALRSYSLSSKQPSTTTAPAPTGNSITYNEAMLNPNLQSAYVIYLGTIIVGTMLMNPITLYLLKNYVFPKPGEGPSMKSMEHKHFLCVRGVAIGKKGSRAESIFYLNKDAGCLETSKMLIESGLCLALQHDALPSKNVAGFMSPSIGLGNVLLDRLIKMGVQFECRSFPPNQSTVSHAKM